MGFEYEGLTLRVAGAQDGLWRTVGHDSRRFYVIADDYAGENKTKEGYGYMGQSRTTGDSWFLVPPTGGLVGQ